MTVQSTSMNSDVVEEAIPVGPFLFSPAVQLTWQDRDNIFFTPDNPVRDQVFQAGARFLFQLPISQSNIRFSYSPQYTKYRNYELTDPWSHFLELGGRFVFSSGLIVDAGYTYVLGNLQTRLVDPGGELVYGDPGFTKNGARVEVEYWVTHRDGLFVDFGWADLDHSDPQFFYDYTSMSGGAGWMHRLSSSLQMDLRYGVIDFDAHDNEYASNSFRDSLSHELTVGFQGQLSPVFGTEFRVGYRTISYDIRPGDPPVEDFSGVVTQGFLSWELAHSSVLRFDVLRAPFPSNYADNANYVATGAGLLYSLDRGSVFGQASTRYQTNDYQLPDPITGLARSDEILSFGLGLGYRFNRRFSLWSTYIYEDRETLYRYSYTTDIITVGLTYGF